MKKNNGCDTSAIYGTDGFHRHVRVVYRACRKKYGIEKTQDECLELFKIVFPEYHKAKSDESETISFSPLAQERIHKLFKKWNPEEELKEVCGYVLARIVEDMNKDDFLRFCDDIMPVVMRIRKLTPRECGRLMSVDEKSLDIMLNCGISKSALYKCFGNSICAGTGTKDSQGNYDGVLFNIFRKLFIETEPDIVKGKPQQLSLF